MSSAPPSLAALAAACLPCALALACAPERPAPAARGEFGIFFGGQIEERREIPFELDRSKQTAGFRVEFTPPLAAATEVEWRIDRRARGEGTGFARPRPAKPAEPAPRTAGGKVTIPAGEARFDQVTPFEPGDPLGLWNIRVVALGHVVIDRPFEVFDAARRKRAERVDGGK